MNDDDAFARARFAELIARYDDEALIRSCARHSRSVLPEAAPAARAISLESQAALRNGVPWSLVRVGDGEGNALAMTLQGWEGVALTYLNESLSAVHGVTLDGSEAASFTQRLLAAIVNADVVGFRSLNRGYLRSPESDVIRSTLDLSTRGALGQLAAREFLEREIRLGSLQKSIITSAWIHLGLMPYISEIADAAPGIVIVSGVSELGDVFRRRFGARLREFVHVPPEGVRPENESESHYHRDLPQVTQHLEQTARGCLVLVGAGLFGKIYCDAAKKGGGVAIDMGSAFDLMAGRATRPIHRRFDLAETKWT